MNKIMGKSMYQALYGAIKNDLHSDKELKGHFSRIIIFAPPDISEMYSIKPWPEIHKTIFEKCIEPIVNNILNSNCDIDAFCPDLLDLGIGLNVSQATLRNKLEILINFWQDSSCWSSTDDRENAFNELEISNILTINGRNAKQFWGYINDALVSWIYSKPECSSLGAINAPYFLTFLGYEVLIALHTKLSNTSVQPDDMKSHFKATTRYIREKDKNGPRAKPGIAISETKIKEVNGIKTIVEKLLNNKKAIIWPSVLSKRVHLIAEKAENLNTQRPEVRQRNNDLLCAIIEEAKDYNVEETTIEAVNQGLKQFNEYVDSVVNSNKVNRLGCDNRARGGELTDQEGIFYGWGQQFYQQVNTIIQSMECSPDMKELIKFFILHRLLSKSTKHDYSYKRMEVLHKGCIQFQVPVYHEIDTLLYRHWGYQESRDFIRNQFKVLIGH